MPFVSTDPENQEKGVGEGNPLHLNKRGKHETRGEVQKAENRKNWRTRDSATWGEGAIEEKDIVLGGIRPYLA
jgi:hypothetical protein